MYCPSCGSQNPAEAKHCMSCGTPLLQSPVSPAPPGAADDARTAGLKLAGLGDRLIAQILDAILLTAAFAVIGMWSAVRWGGLTASGFSVEGKPALVTFAAIGVIGFLYFWFLEGLCGATLGKLLVGIKVQDTSGSACTMGASLIRNLLRLIDGLVVYLVGFLFAIFSKLRQRLGDRLANTVVVQSSPGGLIRGIAVLVWLGGIAGGLWGAYTIHRGATATTTVTETVVIGKATSSTSQTIAKSVGDTLTLSSGEFKLEYAWREGGKEGPIRPPRPFQPGETAHITYELSGYGTHPDGRADVTLEFVPMDPNGLMLYQPRTLSFNQGGTISGHYWFQMHPYVVPGTHQLVIKVRDGVRNSEVALAPPFEIEAPQIAPASALEVRNFHFSAAKDGPALEPADYSSGQTVHYSFDLLGPRFQNDRGHWQIAFQLTGPSGKVLLERPDWDTTNEDFTYHPPTFFIHYSGYVTLPSDASAGAYTVRFIATDKNANTSVTHTAKFQVR